MRRIGDPATRKFHVSRWWFGFAAALVVLVPVVVVYTLMDRARDGNLPELLGLVVGYSIGFIGLGVAAALWFAFWRPLRLRLRDARKDTGPRHALCTSQNP